jgi:Carboxypeptidase regulatory-like domain
MSRRNLYLTLFVAAALAVLVWLWVRGKKEVQPSATIPPKTASTHVQQAATTPPPAPVQLSPAEIEARRQQQVEREKKIWDLALATPISFYGKVVDEKGTPIAGANVDASFADSVWTGDTKRQTTTDEGGFFHLEGHGLGVVVMVSKEGYYRQKESDGRFGYAKSGGSVDPHPDSNNPAIFVLRKMGQTESLVKFESDFRISSNGVSVPVDLATGRTASSNQSIAVEAWIDPRPQDPNSNQPYDWRCRVSVPGGGLIERKGDFNFEAPESGYQPADEINTPASLGPKWRSQIDKHYFVKLGSGNYARIEFTMTAGGERFFTVQSYLNPTVGSRNLEFDPIKAKTP